MCERQVKRFTRGEKCIFTHIIVTILFILIVLFIFIIHLVLVKHNAREWFQIFRKKDSGVVLSGPEVWTQYPQVGVAYLAGAELRVLCTALLLKTRWSLVPGNCARARSEPDLSDYLPAWRLRYSGSRGDVDTAVMKSVPHPQFDRDNFANNVGVLQHETPVPGDDFHYPTAVEDFSDNLELVGWDFGSHGERRIKKLSVYPMPTEECQHFVSSVTEVRPPYEFCAITTDSSHLCFDHGALVYSHGAIVGFFSWGERCARTATPLVMINIKTFQDWLEGITSLNT